MYKLFQINVALNVGSTGRIAEQIGILAKSKGWEVWIAHGPRFVNTSKLLTYQVCSSFEEKKHALKSILLDRHGNGSKLATKKLIKKIKEVQPDIIHLHNIHGYYINYEVLFNYISSFNIPVIWTFHDCWPITGHCSHFDFVKCEYWKTGCHDCVQLKEYPRSLFMDNSYTNWCKKKKNFNSVNNMTLVSVSNWLKEKLGSSFLSKNNIEVIYNGVDLDVFYPRKSDDVLKKYNIYGKHIILGIASFWTKRKGFNDFIELRKILGEEYIIVLVGVSKSQVKKLPKGIIGVCRTSDINQLAELYSASLVFVNPTYEDSFPTTNLESLACGTPVITYRTGGSPEALDDNTGFIVEQGNIDGIVKSINSILIKGKMNFSDACRERAITNFNKSIQFEKYIDLYDKILNIQRNNK